MNKIKSQYSFKGTRKTILDIIHRSGASHIGTCYSVIEILQAVYRSVDIDKIKTNAEDRDRIIVSKGHSAAALYATLFNFGLMSRADLDTYHQNGSLLSGHVSHFVPYVEHSTGALGHGLPVAVGICLGLNSKSLHGTRTYVVVGDGELHEGSNWEALMLAGHHKLENLCVLIDRNCLSGIGKTCDCCSLDDAKEKFESFGFKAIVIDGHNEEIILETIHKSRSSAIPVAIICNTVKGKGASFMEHENVWHYRPVNKEWYDKALLELT